MSSRSDETLTSRSYGPEAGQGARRRDKENKMFNGAPILYARTVPRARMGDTMRARFDLSASEA
jgi:hypothetical protein